MKQPKILLVDIETSPILAYVWDLWKQNVALNQIKTDWHLLSFSAKWLGEPANKIIYMDQRNAKNIEDDKPLLQKIWDLLISADVLITHNGKKFDLKKLNSRFILQGFKPLPEIKHIDTLRLARKNFSFTSNKLEYLSNKICTKYKKLKHEKFSGFELWKECLKHNKQAWKEMEKYNKFDVLSLEELYNKLSPWDDSLNVNLYHNTENIVCKCGSTHFQRAGHRFTKVGKYQRYQCVECGAWTRGRCNEFSAAKKETLRV